MSASAAAVAEGEAEGEVEEDGAAAGISHDEPPVYFDPDGTPVYRASALYGCHNILLNARHGIAPTNTTPPWMQQRYDAGHDHEPLIMRKLDEKFGMRVYGRQVVVELSVGKAKIRGHVDGLNATESFYCTHVNGKPINDGEFGLFHAEGIGILDAKALSVSSYEAWLKRRWAAMPYYAWQQTIYELGLQAAYIVMAVKNKNTDDMVVEVFTEQLVPRAAIFKKVLDVEAAYRRGPAEIMTAECSPKTFPCPYLTLHNETSTKPEARGEVKEALAALVEQRIAADGRIAEAKAEVTTINAQIVELVDGVEVSEKLPIGTMSTYFHGYTGTDWEAIGLAVGCKADEAKEKFTVPKTSDTLSVKVTPKKTRSKRVTPSA